MNTLIKFFSSLFNKQTIKKETEYMVLKKRIEYLHCKTLDIHYFKVILLLLPFNGFTDFKKNLKEASLYLRVNDKSKFERTLIGNTNYTLTMYDLFLSNCNLCDRLEEFKEMCLEFLSLLDERHCNNEPIFYNETRLFNSIISIVSSLEQSEYTYVPE